MFTNVISNCSWLLFLLSDSVLCLFFSLPPSLSLMLKHIHTCTLNHIYLLACFLHASTCTLTLYILCLCFKRGKPKVIVPLMNAKCNGLADRTRPNSWMVDMDTMSFYYILNVPKCFLKQQLPSSGKQCWKDETSFTCLWTDWGVVILEIVRICGNTTDNWCADNVDSQLQYETRYSLLE